MAAGALRILDVQGHQLADGLAVGVGLLGGQDRDIGRRRRDVFAEQLVDHPEAALDGTGPLRLRVLRQEHGHAQHAAATAFVQSGPRVPIRRSVPRKRQAVVLGEPLVDERGIAVEQFRDRPIVLDQVRDEPRRLLEHGLFQRVVERGEHLPVDGFLREEVAVAEPLAEELQREAADLRVLEHPANLLAQDALVAELARLREGQQLLIGHARPEEVAQPRGQRQVGERRDGVARSGATSSR